MKTVITCLNWKAGPCTAHVQYNDGRTGIRACYAMARQGQASVLLYFMPSQDPAIYIRTEFLWVGMEGGEGVQGSRPLYQSIRPEVKGK